MPKTSETTTTNGIVPTETIGLPIVPTTPNKPTPPPPLFAFASLIDKLADDAEARRDAKLANKPFGPVTALKSLDTVLGGALAPGLHIIDGSPGVGKTAFALQVGASCGCPCLYVTCEMTPLELLRRHSARVTNLYLGKFKDGSITRDDARTRAMKAAQAAPLFALLDATETPAAPQQVLEAAEIVRTMDAESRHLLVIVDSLHSWTEGVTTEGEEMAKLNSGLSALRHISKKLDCAVVIISERNRASMTKGGISAGAGTRKLEYGAETMIGLDAEDIEGADGARSVIATINKNRSGSAGGKVNLRFHGALQKYTDPKQDREEYPY